MKTFLTKLVLLFSFAVCCSCVADAQSSVTGVLRGTVSDPSGALVPQAEVSLSSESGSARKVKSSAAGSYEIPRLAPGRYSVTVSAKGFTPATADDVLVNPGKTTTENMKLTVSVETAVQVDADAIGVSVNPDENANSMVIKGKDLDALSDDPEDLQSELSALAGPSAGPSGGQIYIDGFSGGQLPPKSSIREIRINRNPFSAQYDKLGYGRIEILTKPGTDKLHGSLMVMGNDSALNSLNPFVTNEPAYHSTFMMGNVGAALGKNASFFTSVFRRDDATNAIVNAQVLGANGTAQTYSAAVANPQSRLDISSRLDLALGKSNTLTVRYAYYRQRATNMGVSGIALPSQAYGTSDDEHTIQISDTQVLSPRVVNDLRFQLIADRSAQTPGSTAATVTVQGAFTGGGSNAGTGRDNQNHFELQDYVTAAEGKHALNFGGRLRLTHDTNSSSAGFNGNYIYQSLSAYAAGTPSEYTVTSGTPLASLNLFDAGIFYQDDWTVRPNLTLSYGVRYEGQNRISDHNDWAPRFAVTWAPGQRNGQKANTVLRAGYGWFFDRFASTNVLGAIHNNGINQQKFVIKNPSFTSNAPTAAQLAANNSVAPSLTTVAPNLKAALIMQMAVGGDHQFGKYLTLSATYINSRGVHQYLSNNVNAFLPGTYDAATAAGVRPNGVNETIDQFQSGGVFNQNQLLMNYSVRAKKVSLFGFYTLGKANADTSGASYFSSNPFDPGADYGRATFDVRSRFLLGGNYVAPFRISISPFMVANSGSPFNITIGQDLNGDNQYNDRPAYATASSTNVLQTAYGAFDVSPSANSTRIPFDVGTGPGQFSMNLRVSKSFGIGPRMERATGGTPGGGPGGSEGARGGPGGPGGGLGPGGLSGNGGPPRLDQAVPRRYSLTFAVMSRNVLNHVNLAAPVGVLSSPVFGKSTAISGGFFGSSAANRSIDVQATFSF